MGLLFLRGTAPAVWFRFGGAPREVSARGKVSGAAGTVTRRLGAERAPRAAATPTPGSASPEIYCFLSNPVKERVAGAQPRVGGPSPRALGPGASLCASVSAPGGRSPGPGGSAHLEALRLRLRLPRAGWAPRSRRLGGWSPGGGAPSPAKPAPRGDAAGERQARALCLQPGAARWEAVCSQRPRAAYLWVPPTEPELRGPPPTVKAPGRQLSPHPVGISQPVLLVTAGGAVSRGSRLPGHPVTGGGGDAALRGRAPPAEPRERPRRPAALRAAGWSDSSALLLTFQTVSFRPSGARLT